MALNHNCSGIILSAGISGNKNPDKDIIPLIPKNKAKINLNLFIDI